LDRSLINIEGFIPKKQLVNQMIKKEGAAADFFSRISFVRVKRLLPGATAFLGEIPQVPFPQFDFFQPTNFILSLSN
jgi:hypothetical protein